MTKRSREESYALGQPPTKQPRLDDKNDQDSNKRDIIVSDALTYLEQVRLQYTHKPEVYIKFLDVMKDYNLNIIDVNAVSQRVRELLADNPQLILAFNTFLPPEKRFNENLTTGNESSENIVAEDQVEEPARIQTTDTSPNEGQQDEFDEAISFVNRIKERFNTQADIYKRFLDCLQRYQMGTTTITTVYEEITMLFRDEPDLLEDFKKFLPRPVQEEAQRKLKPKQVHVKHPEERNENQHDLQDGVSSEIQHELEIVSGKSYEELDDPIERLKHSRPHGEKYGPSYRLPPKNYPQAVCSYRSDLCRSVLNDELVSVPAGSEESRDSGGRDPAAETLFQCEDDRAELDIVLEQNLSTLRLFAPLNDQIRQGQEVEFSISQLRDIQKAAIHRIYGDKWLEVLESLKQKPHFVIPVIYARLQQKGHEWENARKELNLFWRNLYKENTIRAENQEAHRFKNGEKNRLTPSEIVKDIHERHTFHNYLSSSMKDKSIHKDIFMLLMRHSQLGDDQIPKLKELWSSFVIPFFSLEKKQSNVNNENSNAIVQPIHEQKVNAQLRVQKFYANVTLLLFMRYYLYMYERLRRAKGKSIQQQSTHDRRRDQSSVSAIIEKHNEEVLDTEPFTGYISGATISKRKRSGEFNEMYGEGPHSEDGLVRTSYYHRMLDAVSDLLSGEIETDEYEKKLKKLLGFQAYEMFTFGKLFKLFKNNIVALMKEDECLKLIQAYEYEKQRANPFQDKMYFYNVYKLLGQESCVYCFAFNQQSQRLVVSMIDPPTHDIAKIDREKEGFDYVQKFVGGAMHLNTSCKQKVFLNRNIKKMSIEEANKDVLLYNGLECKICIASFKIFYVQGTSDFMVRKRRNISQNKRDLKGESQRKTFQTWLEKRLNEISSETPESKSQKHANENLPADRINNAESHDMNASSEEMSAPKLENSRVQEVSEIEESQHQSPIQNDPTDARTSS